MTTRETSFRESDHPGIVFPGKKPSGKVTIRETTVNRLDNVRSTVPSTVSHSFTVASYSTDTHVTDRWWLDNVHSTVHSTVSHTSLTAGDWTTYAALYTALCPTASPRHPTAQTHTSLTAGDWTTYAALYTALCPTASPRHPTAQTHTHHWPLVTGQRAPFSRFHCYTSTSLFTNNANSKTSRKKASSQTSFVCETLCCRTLDELARYRHEPSL